MFLFFRYREHIVWTDKALNMKLLRKGILTRIYAPMVSMIVVTLKLNRIFFPRILFIYFFTHIFFRPSFKVWGSLVFSALLLHLPQQLCQRTSSYLPLEVPTHLELLPLNPSHPESLVEAKNLRQQPGRHWKLQMLHLIKLQFHHCRPQAWMMSTSWAKHDGFPGMNASYSSPFCLDVDSKRFWIFLFTIEAKNQERSKRSLGFIHVWFHGVSRFPDHYPSAGVNFLERKRERVLVHRPFLGW